MYHASKVSQPLPDEKAPVTSFESGQHKTMKRIAALVALILLLVFTPSAVTATMSSRIFHSVKDQIQRRPTLTHSIIGCCLFSGSDAFAQHIEAAEEDSSVSRFDTKRFLSAGVVGAFLAGYVYPFAYRRLDKIWAGKDIITIAKKSFVEVFTVGIFANSVSMFARGIFTDKKPMEVLSHVKEEMQDVTLNDLRVWFPYNLVAFSLIPISIRPATTSMMEAGWQTYISMRSNDYKNTGAACDVPKKDNIEICNINALKG